ncbi:MAG: metal-dependent transcriptional regulator [Roseburia sp.]|jgi:DtxR family Mn-dependent transcriptional regulator|nr:metal-dependent transcriptional regulator [Roseburia sp.]
MVMNESNENYLETILILSHRLGNVRSVDIANEMNFKKPSVSVAMKNLRENGFITVDTNGHIHLTAAGRNVAETIYERHTTLTNWLILLGVDPKVAVQDACKIEHDISVETFDALKRHIRAGGAGSESR